MAFRNPVQRLAIYLLETFCDQLWGFKPNLIKPLVKELGAVQSIWWFARYMPRYEQILKSWGPIRTHLIATELSLLNGCKYCATGHGYALQLHYLKATDRLFPLTQADLNALIGQPEAQIIQPLMNGFSEASLSYASYDLLRLLELRRDPLAVTSPRDHWLAHMIEMFEQLNACGLKWQPEPDQAHDPINRNRALRDRYSRFRRQQQQPTASTTTSMRTILHPQDRFESNRFGSRSAMIEAGHVRKVR